MVINHQRNFRFLLAVCSCLTVWSCSDDNETRTLSENKDFSGTIHIATLDDYTAQNHMIMLQDDEPESVFLDASQRSFYPSQPVQVSITENQELLLRAYSPRRINNLKIWAAIEGFEEEFLLAQFDIVPPFLEFRTRLPFVEADQEYRTLSGKDIKIMKNPYLGSGDLSLRIDCDDPYYKKFETIKTTWRVNFSNFDYPNHNYWLAMNPGHCREAVAMSLNMAYLFSTKEYEDSLQANDMRFENRTVPIPAETLLTQSRTRNNFAWGTLHGVGGLGGGSTLGLQDVCFLGHYADDVSESAALFHEFGHGMGYGDGDNTVISEINNGYSWRKMCHAIYVHQSLTKELPIYSRRFMHNRRNHYDQWSNDRLAYYGAAGRYYGSKYVIEDPELDELDGGLARGGEFLKTDSSGNEGGALRFKLNYETAKVEKKNYAPRDIYVYNNRLYVTNDIRQKDYSIDVFDLSLQEPKLLKRITSWKDPKSGEEVALGIPTGICRSYDKIYIAGFGSRIYVLNSDTYACEDFLCPSGGAYSVAIDNGVIYSILNAVRAMPEHSVAAQTPGTVPTIASSTGWKNSNLNTVARDQEGNIYATLYDEKKIVKIDINHLLSGKLDITRELTFENAPQGVCFDDDNRMFVTFENSAAIRFAQVDAGTGKIVNDLTKIGNIELKKPQKCIIRRHTLFITDRNTDDFCLYAIPVEDLK